MIRKLLIEVEVGDAKEDECGTCIFHAVEYLAGSECNRHYCSNKAEGFWRVTTKTDGSPLMRSDVCRRSGELATGAE
jgi:hypothetical protein